MKEFLSQSAMAYALKISPTVFCSLVKRGDLPPPSHQIKIRKYYYQSDVPKIKKAFEAIESRQTAGAWVRIKAMGFLSGVDLAERLDMPHITYQSYLKQGIIPKPAHRIEGVITRVYTEADVLSVRRLKCLSYNSVSVQR